MNRRVRVAVAPDLRPRGFWWGRKWLAVSEVMEDWRDTGQWWEGEAEKHFYRVAAGCGVYELCFVPQGGEWTLYKVYD